MAASDWLFLLTVVHSLTASRRLPGWFCLSKTDFIESGKISLTYYDMMKTVLEDMTMKAAQPSGKQEKVRLEQQTRPR